MITLLPGLASSASSRSTSRGSDSGLYLHEDLDLEAANVFWSDLTSIPLSQHGKPYRADPTQRVRKVKHPMGCPSVIYNCTRTHRLVMGLVAALLSCDPFHSGVAEIGRAADC